MSLDFCWEPVWTCAARLLLRASVDVCSAVVERQCGRVLLGCCWETVWTYAQLLWLQLEIPSVSLLSVELEVWVIFKQRYCFQVLFCAPTEAAVRVLLSLHFVHFSRFEIVVLSETCMVDVYSLNLRNYSKTDIRCRRLLEFYYWFLSHFKYCVPHLAWPEYIHVTSCSRCAPTRRYLTTVNVYTSRRSAYAAVGVGPATTVDAAYSPLTAWRQRSVVRLHLGKSRA